MQPKCSFCEPEGAFVARWMPVLRLFALGIKYGEPTEIVMGMPTCEVHSNSLRVETFTSPISWEQIRTIFSHWKKAEPDPAKTQLTWLPIDDAKAQFLLERGDHHGEKEAGQKAQEVRH